MSFSDHIRACNNYDPARVVPLTAGNARVGLLRRDNAEALRRFPEVFAAGGRALPEGRHKTPFRKKLEHPWHHPGFGTGMNGKAGGGRKVIISD